MKRKKYQWKSKQLKMKYDICDFASLGIFGAILFILFTTPNPALTIVSLLFAIVILQFGCSRFKKADKKL